jgi:hypothetical protein
VGVAFHCLNSGSCLFVASAAAAAHTPSSVDQLDPEIADSIMDEIN